MAKSIEIDRKKRLREEPGKGHNRWHPDIAPVIEAAPGDLLEIEYLDIRPERYGWTRFAPGGGFLPDLRESYGSNSRGERTSDSGGGLRAKARSPVTSTLPGWSRSRDQR